MIAFSIWNAIWVVFVTYLFISVLMLLFTVMIDLFRDKETGAFAKFAWVLFLILAPLIGMLVYVLVRGHGMADRTAKQQAEAQAAFDSRVREVAGGGAASELEKASALHSSGKLSDDEYAALKAKILS